VEPRNLVSLRIVFICFTLIFILGLGEGFFGAVYYDATKKTTNVGQVFVFLAVLLPGTVVGLLARSDRRAFFDALVAGLPALVVVLLLTTYGQTYGQDLKFFPFEKTPLLPLDQFLFRALMFGLLLAVSVTVGRFVAGEPVSEPVIFDVREIGPTEEVEELEKKIEDQVLKEKLSGVQVVEQAAERKEAEGPSEKEIKAPPSAERPVEIKLCPSCGAELPSTAAYCPSCGQSLAQPSQGSFNSAKPSLNTANQTASRL